MRFLIINICLVTFVALGLAQDKEFKKADHILLSLIHI